MTYRSYRSIPVTVTIAFILLGAMLLAVFIGPGIGRAASDNIRISAPTQITAGEVPLEITVEAGEGAAFTNEAFTKVDIMQNGKTVTTATNVQVSTNGITFTITKALAAGSYTVVIVNDFNEFYTTLQVGAGSGSTLQQPQTQQGSIQLYAGDAQLSQIYEGYGQMALRVQGTNTGFSADTVLYLLGASGTGTFNDYLTGVSVQDDSKLSFVLKSGLPKGQYTLSVSTNGAAASTAFAVSGRSVSVSPSTFAGSSQNQMITVTGSGTSFDQTYEVQVLDAAGKPVNAIISKVVDSGTSMRIVLKSGLAAGQYKVKISQAQFELEAAFTVTGAGNEVDKPVVSYIIEAPAMLVVGGSYDLKLKAVHADQSKTDLTSQVSWSGTNTVIASVSAGGNVTANKIGETVIQAKLNGSVVASLKLNIMTGEQRQEDGGDDGAPAVPGIPGLPASQILDTARQPEVQSDSMKTLPTNMEIEDGKMILSINEQVVLQAIARSVDQWYKIAAERQAPVMEAALPSTVLEELQRKGGRAGLVIDAGNVEYELPAKAIDLAAIRKQLNVAADAKLTVNVRIQEAEGVQSDAISSLAAAKGSDVLAKPVEFEVTVQAGGRSVVVNDFGGTFISRSFEIRGAAGDFKSITGVVYHNGQIRHVPTFISVTPSGSLKVTLQRNGNSVYVVLKTDASFTDVPAGHWAKSNIELMASKFILAGGGDGTFRPNGFITRAEFTAIIVRALGLMPKEYTGWFKDIDGSDWFAEEVEAAFTAGIIKGKSADRFYPDERISRQDMAAIIVNAIAAAGKRSVLSESRIAAELSIFKDAGGISGYARLPVAIAVDQGIITGMKADLFAGKESANRAQAATMVLRMLRAIDFTN